jgi:hypothetical protein
MNDPFHYFEKEGSVLDRPGSGQPSASPSIWLRLISNEHLLCSSSQQAIWSTKNYSASCHIHSYRVQLRQELEETGYQAPVGFTNWFLSRMDEDGFQ